MPSSELAVRQPARESPIVLDLSKRQITLVRGEQRLGYWPVAIGRSQNSHTK